MKNARLFQRTREAQRHPRLERHHRHGPPALEWIEDAGGLCPRVTAIGGRSLLVENHRGLLTFSQDRIELDSRCGPLRVTGRGMALNCVRTGAVVIRGDILRLDLPSEGGGAHDEG